MLILEKLYNNFENPLRETLAEGICALSVTNLNNSLAQQYDFLKCVEACLMQVSVMVVQAILTISRKSSCATQ